MGRVRLNEDVLAGLLFVCCGLVGLWISRDLIGGTASAMGPGYLPRALCLCLVALGVFVGVKARAKQGQLQRWHGISLVAVLGSIFAFAFLVPRLGLLVAAFVTVVMAGLASRETRLREVLPLALGLAAVAVAVFIFALGLPIKPWPFG
jgi:hypothetical protein